MRPATNATPCDTADLIASGAAPPASRAGIASTRLVTRSFSLISRKNLELCSSSAARCGAACWRLLIASETSCTILYPAKPSAPSMINAVRITATARGTKRKCEGHTIAGRTRAATAIAESAHAMTRSASRAISRSKNVRPSANTRANAERTDSRTRSVRAKSTIGSYDTDVASPPFGPSVTTAESPPTDGIDLDPRSAIPLAIAVASFAIAVWFIRSIPRTLSSLALAALFAFAVNPLVEALKRRTGWHRRTAAGVVLLTAALLVTVVVALITVPTIREVRDFNKQIPQTVKDLGRLPIVGPRLREAKASEKVQQWLNDVPKHLSTNSKPIENAAGAIADGVAAALFTILLAITIVLDGEFLVGGARRLVPARRRHDADRMGRLVYHV